MSHDHNHKTLLEIHEDVPANHYDVGLKKNLFQKYWHSSRFREVLKVLKPINNGAMLDVGCHGGTFTSVVMGKIGAKEVYGIDISEPAVKYAKKKIPQGNFQVADAAELPFKDNLFDAVICLEVLEHVDNPIKAISEIKRVLKKGGYTVILVPSDNRLFKLVWFIWTMYYPVWRHAHVQSFSADILEAIVKSEGLKIDKVKTFNSGMLKLLVAHKP
jgi:ubiquinone/menaquinone biosynthesis C-methylase UbiE